MSIEELQAKYLEAVGRATGSDDRRYLDLEIPRGREGPHPGRPAQDARAQRRARRRGDPPLRLEAEVVERMDEAWRTRGIKNRMEFFRRALGHYLSHLGADEAAALFTNADAASA
ncbi:MAG: ribbon-helix-helix domain-containing protein [Microthrixaceae bacterium]